MDRDKRVINSKRISRAMNSRRATENENQVKLKGICFQCTAAQDYHQTENHPLNDTGKISAYKFVEYFLMENHII